MNSAIKKATELAENELQENEIQHFKKIIKDLLQKKKDKEKEKTELDEEIKIIKQDIDDFKAGRLDKIKERHDKNPIADRVAPIQITIINDNSRTIYPLQPWRWNYIVNGWDYPTCQAQTLLTIGTSQGTTCQSGYSYNSGGISGVTGQERLGPQTACINYNSQLTANSNSAGSQALNMLNSLQNIATSSQQAFNGSSFGTFTGGTYDLGNGNIVNL